MQKMNREIVVIGGGAAGMMAAIAAAERGLLCVCWSQTSGLAKN